jgi:hypothetical protein
MKKHASSFITTKKRLWFVGKRKKNKGGENNMELHFLVAKECFALLRQEGHRRFHIIIFYPFARALKSTLEVSAVEETKLCLHKCPSPTFLITNSLKDTQVLCTQSHRNRIKEKKVFQRKQFKYHNCLPFSPFFSGQQPKQS